MKTFATIFLFIIFNSFIYCQPNYYMPTEVVTTTTEKTPVFFYTSSSQCVIVYRDSITLNYMLSSDNGSTWFRKGKIDSSLAPGSTLPYLDGIVMNNGKLVVFYKKSSLVHSMAWSDDGGNTWSPFRSVVFPGTSLSNSRVIPKLSLRSDGSLLITINQQGIVKYLTSTDMGATWSGVVNLNDVADNTITDAQVVDQGNNEMYYAYIKNQSSSENKILLQKSVNGGISWTPPVLFDTSISNPQRFKLFANSENELVLFSEQLLKNTQGIDNSEILISKSNDRGLTWSVKRQLTRFIGEDRAFNITFSGNKYHLAFLTNRNSNSVPAQNYRVFFGTADFSYDKYTNPFAFIPEIYLSAPLTRPVTLRVYSNNALLKVSLLVAYDTDSLKELKLFDDGTHGDSVSGDNIFSGYLNEVLSSNIQYKFWIRARIKLLDVDSNRYEGKETGFELLNGLSKPTEFIDFNNLKLPVNAQGNLGGVTIPGNPLTPGISYRGGKIAHSIGLFLSGKNSGTLWGNGVFPSSNVADYNELAPLSLKGKIYSVSASDPAFGLAWQEWRMAVINGARYYDGNRDGSYNPVDLNSNGQWDPNEDRPDVLGDKTYFCAYADNVDTARRFTNMHPLGIQILQTVFGWNQGENHALSNTLFVRYEIKNANSGVPRMDSVYISGAMDPDIGYIYDDLVGTDTTRNTIYSYQKYSDVFFGNTAPAVFLKVLQGPQYSKAGETFIDVNGNGVFDKGIDTPLKNVILNKGRYLGTDTLFGYSERKLTSSMNFIPNQPQMSDPTSVEVLRNYAVGGRMQNGTRINPCTWEGGNISNLPNCNQINPAFIFSGNPETMNGWINAMQGDHRIIANSGPFTLNYGIPIEVVYALTVSESAVSPVNSISTGKMYLDTLNSIFNRNYILGLDNIKSSSQNNKLEVQPNFPNPFRTITRIRYTLGYASKVKVKVFNLLGELVVNLADEQQYEGVHSFDYTAGTLPSGIYFCEIQTERETAVIKMICAK